MADFFGWSRHVHEFLPWEDAAPEAGSANEPPGAPVVDVPTVTRLLMLLGSRHTTRPAHAGVGGHHTTVSPLFFIAYPQTRVPAPSMLGPYAGTAGAGPNPLLDCSNPAS